MELAKEQEPKFLQINLGCGSNTFPGFVNVDKFPPDSSEHEVLKLDIEHFPWPWANESVQEIYCSHILEHVGQTPEVWMKLWQEMYRVLIPGGLVIIHVPHPDHDHFRQDPTHVRAVTKEGLQLFDQCLNLKWQKEAWANTPLGLHYGIDFQVVRSALIPSKFFLSRYAGEEDEKRLTEALYRDTMMYRNQAQELQMIVHKALLPPGRPSEGGAV